MDLLVSILQCRRSGAIVMAPYGTFEGCGAYILINPVRMAPSSASAAEVGALARSILASAGPTGLHIREQKAFLAKTADSETARVRQAYPPDLPPRRMDKHFKAAHLSHKSRQKSYLIKRFTLAEDGFMTGRNDLKWRVRLDASDEELGRAIAAAFDAE